MNRLEVLTHLLRTYPNHTIWLYGYASNDGICLLNGESWYFPEDSFRPIKDSRALLDCIGIIPRIEEESILGRIVHKRIWRKTHDMTSIYFD